MSWMFLFVTAACSSATRLAPAARGFDVLDSAPSSDGTLSALAAEAGSRPESLRFDIPQFASFARGVRAHCFDLTISSRAAAELELETTDGVVNAGVALYVMDKAGNATLVASATRALDSATEKLSALYPLALVPGTYKVLVTSTSLSPTVEGGFAIEARAATTATVCGIESSDAVQQIEARERGAFAGVPTGAQRLSTSTDSVERLRIFVARPPVSGRMMETYLVSATVANGACAVQAPQLEHANTR